MVFKESIILFSGFVLYDENIFVHNSVLAVSMYKKNALHNLLPLWKPALRTPGEVVFYERVWTQHNCCVLLLKLGTRFYEVSKNQHLA